MGRKVGYLAAIWAATYSVVALRWKPADDLSLIRFIPAKVGAPLFAIMLLATAVVAFAMAGQHAVRLRGLPRYALLTFGWLVSAALLFAVPDITLLQLAGYAPMLIIGAPFGWPPVEYSEIFTLALLNQVWCVLGGLLLARTVLGWQLASRGACVSCGRPSKSWYSPQAAARWGRWAAYVAAVIPALYAITRLAWLAGIPLGISREFLRDLQESGAVWAGAGLGTFAIVGSILTLGLVKRWGERLAGRRVPIKLAVVPALLVAVMVIIASISLLSLPQLPELGLTALPMFLWPLWGVALATAAFAYYLRRRGRCAACGLGA